MSTFSNPVLAGCYPDPSVCRVGEDFYLVTSSFAYYPGIPLFHSRDLVSWRQLTHVLNRPQQLSLTGLDVSHGVWAPTIRYHKGTFYVVTSIAKGRQGTMTFVVTARDPAGPWSDPILLEADGFDPSLFFDDDGRCWFTACRDAADPVTSGPGELWMRELDLETFTLVGPMHVLWSGAMRGAWVEAPHIYKRDGVYHLIAAEGGSEDNHAVTAARADAVTGPYITDPRSPLLTHRHRSGDEPVHNVGHVDLVDTADGETWAVALGIRPIRGTHTLGREVFLVPVEWSPKGPVFAPQSGSVLLSERLPTVAGQGPVESGGVVAGRVVFDQPELGLEWNSLRGPVDEFIRPSALGSGLDIDLGLEPLNSTGTPAFIGRRQQHVRFLCRTSISFAASSPWEEAGLAVHHDQNRYATLALTLDASGGPEVVLTVGGSRSERVASVGTAGTNVLLAVEGDETGYTFQMKDDSAQQWTRLGSIERSYFSSERMGGSMVGVYLGLYGTSNGHASDGRAHVHWFEYLMQGTSGFRGPSPE